MNPKPWWMSKTVVTNILLAIVSIAGSLTEVIPDQYDKYLVMVVSAANIGLRLISQGQVTITSKK